MLNAPDASEVLPRISSVARFLTVSSAALTGAPDGSCTVPTMLLASFASADAPAGALSSSVFNTLRIAAFNMASWDSWAALKPPKALATTVDAADGDALSDAPGARLAS